MLKLKISQLQNSKPVNIGKTLYTIESDNLTWVFRKSDSKIIIRRNSNKNIVKEFASSYCSTHNAQIYIKNETGNITDIIDF